jgi:hypothetical protein
VSATELLTDKDEFLIIGCDGVWDVVNYQEVRLSKAFFFSVHCRHTPHCLFSLLTMAMRV